MSKKGNHHPGILLRDRFKLFLITLPFLVFVEMLDIPVLPATRCNEVMRANLLHDSLAGKRFGSYWAAFLHTGGRAALSVVAADLGLGCFYLGRSRRKAAAGAAAAKVNPVPAKIGRNDPCPCGGGRKYKNCCGAK
jgi:hypothetical protein